MYFKLLTVYESFLFFGCVSNRSPCITLQASTKPLYTDMVKTAHSAFHSFLLAYAYTFFTAKVIIHILWNFPLASLEKAH